MRNLVLVGAMGLLTVGGLAAMTSASPPDRVTPELLARGTYDPFKIKAHRRAPVNFRAKTKSPMDVVVRRHTYQPGAHTGWHSHPGPVFITVTKGKLVYYEAGDRRCRRHVVEAGKGFVDYGHGHIVRNEFPEPAEDVSVILAPVGQLFRGELPAPNRHCGF